ncbi:hypothetical protein CDAR_97911, partial [Caerostris darwini]
YPEILSYRYLLSRKTIDITWGSHFPERQRVDTNALNTEPYDDHHLVQAARNGR